jgi:hypothetical protein
MRVSDSIVTIAVFLGYPVDRAIPDPGEWRKPARVFAIETYPAYFAAVLLVDIKAGGNYVGRRSSTPSHARDEAAITFLVETAWD